jgi:large subunit ribosomal protein L6
MSHIGKQLISVPTGVTVTMDAGVLTVKGPKGELSMKLHPLIEVTQDQGSLTVAMKRKTKQSTALWGTTRARVANMVQGVTVGFKKTLEMHGVGYRAALKGKDLELSVGFSHPVKIAALPGISFVVSKELITIEGIDKQAVGQVAAEIRLVRPPEPYKGKGIRYQGEHVRRKVGKVVGTTGA